MGDEPEDQGRDRQQQMRGPMTDAALGEGRIAGRREPAEPHREQDDRQDRPKELRYGYEEVLHQGEDAIAEPAAMRGGIGAEPDTDHRHQTDGDSREKASKIRGPTGRCITIERPKSPRSKCMSQRPYCSYQGSCNPSCCSISAI